MAAKLGTVGKYDPGGKIFLLLYLTIYLLSCRRDYCLSNSPIHVCFLHNPAHCIGLEVLILTKTITPNQQLDRSYPTLQAIEAYFKGRTSW